jgi:hypothetical protein
MKTRKSHEAPAVEPTIELLSADLLWQELHKDHDCIVIGAAGRSGFLESNSRIREETTCDPLPVLRTLRNNESAESIYVSVEGLLFFIIGHLHNRSMSR